MLDRTHWKVVPQAIVRCIMAVAEALPERAANTKRPICALFCGDASCLRSPWKSKSSTHFLDDYIEDLHMNLVDLG